MNKLIAFLQTFGIILVVAGHMGYPASGYGVIHTWIYNFHMPLFMFISGYLMNSSDYGRAIADIPLFIKKKAKRLLIPYIAISSLVYLPKAMMSGWAMRAAEFPLWPICIA